MAEEKIKIKSESTKDCEFETEPLEMVEVKMEPEESDPESQLENHEDGAVSKIEFFEEPLDIPSTSKGNEESKIEVVSSLENQSDKIDGNLFPASVAKKIKKSKRYGKEYNCNDCDYKTLYRGNLVMHLKRHTGEKHYKCDQCSFSCFQKVHLKAHFRKHSGEKPFSCKICDFKCAFKPSLVLHERMHSGEKPFTCNLCDYSFWQKSDLSRHNRSHTGEKPYKCNLCNYRCTQKQHLTTHNLLHTGEKPFKCYVCEYATVRKTLLRSHMKTKHKLTLV